MICCRNNGYLPEVEYHGCCDGEGLRNGMSCCGSRIYNSSEELCCNGCLYDLDELDYCCHDENDEPTYPYNDVDEWCCKGAIYRRVESGVVHLNTNPKEVRVGECVGDPNERIPDEVLAARLQYGKCG